MRRKRAFFFANSWKHSFTWNICTSFTGLLVQFRKLEINFNLIFHFIFKKKTRKTANIVAHSFNFYSSKLHHILKKLIFNFRDIKCENIFLDDNYNVKLGDFSFTRELQPYESSNTYCGTRPYAAIEMLSGRTYSGNTVDIWSAGVVLYVMLTGKILLLL